MEMYRKALFCVLLRHWVDACHCSIGHTEWAHHVRVVWLAAYSRTAHPRDLARKWSAVFGELNGAVGTGDGVVIWHLAVVGPIAVVG